MTDTLNGEQLAKRISSMFPNSVEQYSDNTVWITSDNIVDVALYLRDEPSLRFNFLNSITGVDLIDKFEVVYHLTSLKHNHTAVVKTSLLGRDDPSTYSVINVWRGADLQEREVWDLMGIRFDDHPNLKRLFLWPDFPGHPLRKDFQDTRPA